eukprot:351779-Chlamydomonas_euryale.AAC.3
MWRGGALPARPAASTAHLPSSSGARQVARRTQQAPLAPACPWAVRCPAAAPLPRLRCALAPTGLHHPRRPTAQRRCRLRALPTWPADVHAACGAYNGSAVSCTGVGREGGRERAHALDTSDKGCVCVCVPVKRHRGCTSGRGAHASRGDPERKQSGRPAAATPLPPASSSFPSLSPVRLGPRLTSGHRQLLCLLRRSSWAHPRLSLPLIAFPPSYCPPPLPFPISDSSAHTGCCAHTGSCRTPPFPSGPTFPSQPPPPLATTACAPALVQLRDPRRQLHHLGRAAAHLVVPRPHRAAQRGAHLRRPIRQHHAAAAARASARAFPAHPAAASCGVGRPRAATARLAAVAPAAAALAAAAVAAGVAARTACAGAPARSAVARMAVAATNACAMLTVRAIEQFPPRGLAHPQFCQRVRHVVAAVLLVAKAIIDGAGAHACVVANGAARRRAGCAAQQAHTVRRAVQQQRQPRRRARMHERVRRGPWILRHICRAADVTAAAATAATAASAANAGAAAAATAAAAAVVSLASASAACGRWRLAARLPLRRQHDRFEAAAALRRVAQRRLHVAYGAAPHAGVATVAAATATFTARLAASAQGSLAAAMLPAAAAAAIWRAFVSDREHRVPRKVRVAKHVHQRTQRMHASAQRIRPNRLGLRGRGGGRPT